MRIVLAADVFPPLRISGAVQLRDLCLEFVRQGNELTVLTPALPGVLAPGDDWHIEDWQGIRIVRLRSSEFRDLSYVKRTIGEFLMPFEMLRSLGKSPLAKERWDGVVWYSPSVFLGPLAAALKRRSRCRSYLILRDIFPKWAFDLGLIGRGAPYYFFKMVERYLYSVANTIGVQTPANLPYFDRWRRSGWRGTDVLHDWLAAAPDLGRKVEVLHNWLAETPDVGSSIQVRNTTLAGRKIFLYAGNMGIAQGMDHIIGLVDRLKDRKDIGFLFVGRGGNAKRLRTDCELRGLDNILFFDEVDPSEISGLCAQSVVGLVALDPRHQTHNVPGKFLAYMRGGLPVLANINPGNDLATLIEDERVGHACTDGSLDTLVRLAEKLLDDVASDPAIRSRCKAVADSMFSPRVAVEQIVRALQGRA